MKFTKRREGHKTIYTIEMTDISADVIIKALEKAEVHKIPNNDHGAKKLWRGLVLLPKMETGTVEIGRL